MRLQKLAAVAGIVVVAALSAENIPRPLHAGPFPPWATRGEDAGKFHGSELIFDDLAD